jgi:hypothetical protein
LPAPEIHFGNHKKSLYPWPRILEFVSFRAGKRS